jgi:hypothetical protein
VARGVLELEHGKLLLATFDIGIGLGLTAAVAAVEEALQICIADGNREQPIRQRHRQEIRRL